MNFKNISIIKNEHLKFLENKILNKEFDLVESKIESLSKENFNIPVIKLLYANSKALNKKSNIQDKKLAFDIFVEIYNSNKKLKNILYSVCALCFELESYNEVLFLIENFIQNNEYDSKIYNTLYKIYAALGETKKANNILKKIIEKENTNLKSWSALIFTSLNLEDTTQEEIFKLSKKFSKNLPSYEIKENIKSSKLNNKIVIGFITPYFDGNSIDVFLLGFIKKLNRDKFHIIGFNLNVSDSKSDHLKNYFDNWYHVNQLNDLDLITFIRKKNINILIDLVGHGPGNRLTIFKNRSAPIQLSWLGYTNTTGLKEMDYIIVDPYLVKKEEKSLYSEKFLFLPSIWNSHEKFDTKLKIAEPPLKKNNYLTFGSFNNFKKISPSVIKVWSKILEETTSKLILKSSMNNRDDLRKNFLSKFPKQLIENNKITLMEGQKDKKDHLNLYNKIDVALDTFPYNGVTTSIEAIWMGVPVLTLKGYNFTSRCGESININCNLKEFIAKNKNDYIQKAIELTKNTDSLVRLKENLREESSKTTLFNTKKFTDELSKQLINLWEKNNTI